MRQSLYLDSGTLWMLKSGLKDETIDGEDENPFWSLNLLIKLYEVDWRKEMTFF
jgi:hypothetical protein